MSNANKYNIAIALIFIWIGFVGGISFLEAWLKFRAPGITRPLGLGIGRLVFNALNKVEWVLFVGTLLNMVLVREGKIEKSVTFPLAFVSVILPIQTVWLLPALDTRADAIIKGMELRPSHLHLYYVVLECIKVIALLWSGIKLLRR